MTDYGYETVGGGGGVVSQPNYGYSSQIVAYSATSINNNPLVSYPSTQSHYMYTPPTSGPVPAASVMSVAFGSGGSAAATPIPSGATGGGGGSSGSGGGSSGGGGGSSGSGGSSGGSAGGGGNDATSAVRIRNLCSLKMADRVRIV